MATHIQVRRATPADAETVARLLDAFNREYGDPTPGPEVLWRRIEAMLAADELAALLVGDPAEGVAVLTARPHVWTEGSLTTLDELYVVPERRGNGLGRALLRAAIDLARERGASTIEVGTGEGDAAARHLYEAHGFTNLEQGGTERMLYYEREL